MGRGAGTAFLYTKLVPSTFPPCNSYGVFYMSMKTIFSLVQVKRKEELHFLVSNRRTTFSFVCEREREFRMIMVLKNQGPTQNAAFEENFLWHYTLYALL